jgi:hypothetical protein
LTFPPPPYTSNCPPGIDAISPFLQTLAATCRGGNIIKRAEREHFFVALSTVFVCNLIAMLGDYLNSLCRDQKDLYS